MDSGLWSGPQKEEIFHKNLRENKRRDEKEGRGGGFLGMETFPVNVDEVGSYCRDDGEEVMMRKFNS